MQISFIHGGALRDPDITSRSILPSLPALFSLPGFPLLAVASLNYRLAPYPNHPTAPSHPSDPSRNVVWPAPLEDVVQAIHWLASGEGRQLWKNGGEKSKGEEGIILAGHSVGATLCLHAAPQLLSLPAQSAGRVRAVVGVAGVYDFSALRDAHLHIKAVYEEINTGSFGPEKHENGGEWRGGWGRGKVDGREWRAEGVEVVVLGHGRGDELVDMGQAERLVRDLEGGGTQHGGEKSPVVRMVECKGNHAEMLNVGEEVGRCVWVAVEVMLD